MIEYRFEVKYFVLDAETEETLATTKKIEIANLIAENYERETLIRSTTTAIPKLAE